MSVFADETGAVKSWVTYSVVALVILVGGYFVRDAWNKGSHPDKAAMLCVKCGYTKTRELQVGASSPAKCPKCGNESLYAAFPCYKCRAPNVWNQDLGLAGPTQCRKCGAENVHGRS
jgi:hypothetical protein